MDSVDDCDQTMTEEIAPKKVRSGVFGIIAMFSSLIILLTSFLGTSRDAGTYKFSENRRLVVLLSVSSSSFLETTDPNVCSGIGKLRGITGSTLYIKSSSWNESLIIPKGTLNSQGDCEYTLKTDVGSNFSDSSVNVTVEFPFGTSPAKSYPLPELPPFGNITVEIALS